MDLRYKHVEAALASALGIKAGEMPAFKARLLYLRNMGLPKLSKVGSGQQITYTERHALEILIAILLERGGQSPSMAAQFAKTIVATLPPFFGPDGELRLDEYVARETKRLGGHPGEIRIAVSATDNPTSLWIMGERRDTPIGERDGMHGALAIIEGQFMSERSGRKRLESPPPFLVMNISAWVTRLRTELNRVIEAG
jgi:hypothetical protein